MFPDSKDKLVVSLVEDCLILDPCNRISAAEALQHSFFQDKRPSSPISDIPPHQAKLNGNTKVSQYLKAIKDAEQKKKDEKGEDEKDENYAQVMVNALSVGLESNKRRTPKEETTRTRTRTRKRTTTIVLQETTTPDESSGVAAVPIGPPKTPLVLHFNSHDGKGMMHDVGEALKARRGGK